MVVFLSITIYRELEFECGKRNLLVVVAQNASFRAHPRMQAEDAD